MALTVHGEVESLTENVNTYDVNVMFSAGGKFMNVTVNTMHVNPAEAV